MQWSALACINAAKDQRKHLEPGYKYNNTIEVVHSEMQAHKNYTLTLSTLPIYKQNVCINIEHLVLNPIYKIMLAYGVNGQFMCPRLVMC